MTHMLAMILAVLVSASPAPAESKTSKPNIIFILADDLGIAGLSCYGGDECQTPRLDGLARSGVRFDHCFSAPLCAPSRALCMFGRYAFRTGVLDNGCGARAKPDAEVCVARTLKGAGYATAVAGKWRQLSYFTTKEEGQAWGFDEFMIWGVSGNKEKGDRYWDPAYNHNGQMLSDVAGKYGPDLLQNFAMDFIRRHKDGPFFLYYPMVLIHGPILRTPDSQPGSKTLYADNIAYTDKQVGQLVDELDRLQIREKTLVVFAGDNGSTNTRTLGGRTIDGGKGRMTEGGSRVPLIADWKGTVPAGAVCQDLVNFSDFYATFAELAGAKLPEGVTLDSVSFAPQLLGKPGSPREFVYVQLGNKRYIRDPHWKLTASGEFSDMQEAPFREIPVPGDTTDPKAQAARQRLQAELDKLLSQDTGQFTGGRKAEKAAKGDKQAKKDKKERRQRRKSQQAPT